MFTMLRRLFWLGLLGGAGYAGWTIWQRQNAPTPAAPPEWPPMPASDAPDTPGTTKAPATSAPTESQPARAERWVEPVDGACPDGHPVKANDKSGIYHVPGGRFYERTLPDRCYADAAGAEADGYRAAKA